MSAEKEAAGPFIGDLSDTDMVHVSIIRSPVASGRLRSISLPDLPGGYTLIRAQDIPGTREFSLFDASMPLLASDVISYPGEPVGLLVGPDAEACADLAAAAVLDCEEAWPLFSFESFSSDQILAKKSIENPVRAEGEPDPFAAFEDPGFRRYERNYRTGSQDHWYPEPQGAFVSFDYDKLIVHTGTQWPFHVRERVAAALGKATSDIIVKPVAGSTHLDGKLWYPSLLSSFAALAAVATGKSARLLLSRHEDFQHSPKRSRSLCNLRAAIAPDGSIAALECQITLDTGAYGFLAREMLERMCASVSGAYRTGALRLEAYAVKTNTLPLGPCSGLGMSQSFFAIESFVSEIIEDLEADPLEWRRANLLPKGGLLPTGEKLKEAPPFDALAELVTQASDFRRKHSSYELLRKRSAGLEEGPLRGIAFSFACQANGFLSSGEDRAKYSVEAVMDKDLGLTILSGAVPSSSGIVDIWKREAAQILSIDASAVRVVYGTTDGVPDSGPSTLSRNVSVVTHLVQGCAAAIQAKRFRDALPIVVRKTFRQPREGAAAGGQAALFSWAACVVEVEVDRATLEPRVIGVWLAVDAGRILCERRATSSLESAAVAALSWASRERLELIDGRVAEHVFMRYSIPRMDEIPPITVRFRPDAAGPSRGIGELPGHLLPAAYARALSQALGKALDSIPIDSAKIVQEVGRT